MFKTMADLVARAEGSGLAICEVMLEQEAEQGGQDARALMEAMGRRFRVMKEAIAKGIEGVASHSGMTGYDAQRLYAYMRAGRMLTDETLLKAICYAVATNEVNAAMGVICATPTAGSCGVLPGVLVAVQEKYGYSDAHVVKHLFTAGAVGLVIGNNASLSGAAGGCQAEVGSASAMAAAALVEMVGGSPRQAAHAMAIALKNMLGLTCDPLAGLVEVPCIKRNAGGAANAVTAAEMALAGVESKVPWDEVIAAMQQIGLAMPAIFRETALGGLAAGPTGKAWKKKLWQR